ncbi:hypothetical protein MP228_001672 [Amoeboaphelidium protococcarum]|nr:hypothetical protein MP228_001672 [Amoeboaphelidium protococcarum]
MSDQEQNQNVLKLYSFPNCPREPIPPALSNFVVKVETYLRIKGVKYEKITRMSEMGKSPTGKLPFIEYQGEIVADSALIIQYLEKKLNLETLSLSYSEQELAIGYSFKSMIEEWMYFLCLYQRWQDGGDYFWDVMFAPKLSMIVSYFFKWYVVSGMKKKLYEQGVGRHSSEQVLKFIEEALSNLSAFLGSKKYLLGDQVHPEYDASVFGLLVNMAYASAPHQEQFRQIVWSKSNLVKYVDRMLEVYYPEKFQLVKDYPYKR